MATKNTNSTAVKKVNYSAKYGKSLDKSIRPFSNYLREVVADFNALVVNPNTKESADYLSKADAERIAFAKEVFNSAAFSVDNLTLGYIKKYYPFINAANQICDVKKIAAEEEAIYKKQAEEAAKAAKADGKTKEEAAAIVAKLGLQFTYNKDNVLLRLVPVDIWTGAKVLAKIKAAKKAEEAAKKAEAAAENEAKKAAKEAATIEALKLRIAELEAKQAARSSSDNCNKASKKQQQKAA